MKQITTQIKREFNCQKIFLDKDTKKSLMVAVNNNLPVLLVGETGTGKTSMVRELASELKRKLIRINLTGQTGVDELIGKFLANEKGTYWIDGLLIQAMKRGAWVVLDEINMALPEILSKLHSLLDDDRKILLNEKDGEMVKPHDDFRFFATMNPCDEYAGTKELNRAFLSRFPVVLEVVYSVKEREIIMTRTKVDKPIADMLIVLAKELRGQKNRGELSYTCSTRDLIYCADLIKNGLPHELAITISIINKAPRDEQNAIKKLVSLVTGKQIKISDSLVFENLNQLIEKAKDFEKELTSQRKNMEYYREKYEEIAETRDNLQEEISLIREQKIKLTEEIKQLKEIKELKKHD